MDARLRPGTRKDTTTCGRILFVARACRSLLKRQAGFVLDFWLLPGLGKEKAHAPITCHPLVKLGQKSLVSS